MTIRVVTDSGCDLPEALIESSGITVVPLTVRFGPDEYVDRVELDAGAFWDRMRTSNVLPETSAPAPGRFEDAFRGLLTGGATGVVCITMSSRLSATMQAAQVAAAAAADAGPVAVVDSLTVSMGLGNLCLAAARRAATGATLDAVLEEVADRRDRTRVVATLDTLENLKRGGRIGNARALLGSVLSIKPIVEIRDGVVEEAGKVRTRSNALRAIAAWAAREPIESLALLHGDAPDTDTLLELLAPVASGAEIVTGLVGPVIGTHAGPGVIGIAFQVTRGGTEPT